MQKFGPKLLIINQIFDWQFTRLEPKNLSVWAILDFFDRFIRSKLSEITHRKRELLVVVFVQHVRLPVLVGHDEPFSSRPTGESRMSSLYLWERIKKKTFFSEMSPFMSPFCGHSSNDRRSHWGVYEGFLTYTQKVGVSLKSKRNFKISGTILYAGCICNKLQIKKNKGWTLNKPYATCLMCRPRRMYPSRSRHRRSSSGVECWRPPQTPLRLPSHKYRTKMISS